MKVKGVFGVKGFKAKRGTIKSLIISNRMSQITERDRLTEGLNREDKEVVKVSLVEYMLKNDYRAIDLAPDLDLCTELLSIIVSFNKEWQGIESNPGFQDSKLAKDMLAHLRNQWRNKGVWLNKKLLSE